MIRKIGVIAFMFTVALNAQTIETSIQKAININPEIQESVSNYYISLQRLKEAQGSYNPTLDASFEGGNEYTATPANLYEKKILFATKSTLEAKLNLFNGFKDKSNINEMLSNTEVERFRVLEKTSEIIKEVTSSYIDVLRNKKLLEISKKNVRSYNNSLMKIDKKVKEGGGSESDLFQVQARYELSVADRIIAQKDYEKSKINFIRLVGETPKLSGLKKNVKISNDLETLIATALENNPSVNLAKFSVKSKKENYKKTGSEFFPKVDLALVRNWTDNIHGLEKHDNSHKAVVQVQYNIYNGGIDEAKKVAALYNVDKYNNRLLYTKEKVTEQVKSSYNKYTMIQRQIIRINKYVNNMEQTNKLYKREYEETGKRSTIDVLNAEQEVNLAKLSRVKAKYDLLEAYFDILIVTGEIFAYFDIDKAYFENLRDGATAQEILQ
jgi:adhesin transport system outer membrane protein